MKLSICLFFLFTLTLTSALEIIIHGKSYNTPLKGYWRFLEFSEGDSSVCCPFDKLKMKVGEPDKYDVIHMIGSASFAPELASRCMIYEKPSKDMDIAAAGGGTYGHIDLKYKDSTGYEQSTYLTIQQKDWRNDSLITLNYRSYDSSRSIECTYKMVKDEDASSFIGLFKGADVWKLCLIVAVLIIGIGLACQRNIYKAEAMQVQEDDGIQRYQAPQQYIQQQPENVL